MLRKQATAGPLTNALPSPACVGPGASLRPDLQLGDELCTLLRACIQAGRIIDLASPVPAAAPLWPAYLLASDIEWDIIRVTSSLVARSRIKTKSQKPALNEAVWEVPALVSAVE